RAACGGSRVRARPDGVAADSELESRGVGDARFPPGPAGRRRGGRAGNPLIPSVSDASRCGPPPSVRALLALVGVLAVAAGVRAIAWSNTAVLFNDGPIFLAM